MRGKRIRNLTEGEGGISDFAPKMHYVRRIMRLTEHSNEIVTSGVLKYSSEPGVIMSSEMISFRQSIAHGVTVKNFVIGIAFVSFNI